jgi:SAM-dependent methyltransferase
MVSPAFWKPAARAVYHRLFRVQLRIRCWFADRLATPRLEVPLPPALLRYRVCESLSSGEFLRIGEGCAGLIEQHLGEMGIDLAEARRVLDFGCGCGRTLRWFLDREGRTEFYGADVDAEAIAWCRRHLLRGHFLATSPAPPLPYPAGHFDAVYCLSVFTHLSESLQDLWLPELNRILRPGGALLLTVHGEAAAQALDAEGRDILRARGFVHRRSQKLRGLVPDWYHTSWHSREYILNRLSPWFEDIRYREISGGLQDVVVAKATASVEGGL